MPRLENYKYGTFPSIPEGIETVSLSDSLTYSGVKGFCVDLTGTLAVEMADGSSGTIPVIGGAQYAGAVKKVKSTGSSTVTSVTLFY